MATILHIEDDEQLATIIRVGLRKAGYDVIHVETAEDGLQAAREHHPTIILMDLWLPQGIDGWEAAEMLKSDADLAAIPVIAVSAQNSPEAKRQAEQVGFDGYLTKPFKLDELLEVIETVLA